MEKAIEEEVEDNIKEEAQKRRITKFSSSQLVRPFTESSWVVVNHRSFQRLGPVLPQIDLQV